MTVRVFVNDRGVDAPAGGTAADALRAFDPALAARIEGGDGYVTDARGIAVPLDARVGPGTILRAVPGRARADGPDADA
jgi:hypothetical protein